MTVDAAPSAHAALSPFHAVSDLQDSPEPQESAAAGGDAVDPPAGAEDTERRLPQDAAADQRVDQMAHDLAAIQEGFEETAARLQAWRDVLGVAFPDQWTDRWHPLELVTGVLRVCRASVHAAVLAQATPPPPGYIILYFPSQPLPYHPFTLSRASAPDPRRGPVYVVVPNPDDPQWAAACASWEEAIACCHWHRVQPVAVKEPGRAGRRRRK